MSPHKESSDFWHFIRQLRIVLYRTHKEPDRQGPAAHEILKIIEFPIVGPPIWNNTVCHLSKSTDLFCWKSNLAETEKTHLLYNVSHLENNILYAENFSSVIFMNLVWRLCSDQNTSLSRDLNRFSISFKKSFKFMAYNLAWES